MEEWAITVGGQGYVEQLNIKAIGRKNRMTEDGYELAEAEIPYNRLLMP